MSELLVKGTNHQVLMKFQQICLKQKVGQFAVRSINFYSVRNKEELPEQWKQSVILPVYKQGEKTDGSSC